MLLPSNPLLAEYVAGGYLWALLLGYVIVVRPFALGAALSSADQDGVPRVAMFALLLVMYTVAWPVTAVAMLVGATRR